MLSKGMTLRIEALDNRIITTSTKTRYALGPMPTEHARHPGESNAKVNDVLVVENPQPNGQALVMIYNGCGCRFMLYPQSN